MDKWLTDKPPQKKEIMKKEDQIADEDLEKAKLEKLRELMGKKPKQVNETQNQNLGDDDFLSSVSEFKQWLDQRTYLKGDIQQIETWIKILHRKLYPEENQISRD